MFYIFIRSIQQYNRPYEYRYIMKQFYNNFMKANQLKMSKMLNYESTESHTVPKFGSITVFK